MRQAAFFWPQTIHYLSCGTPPITQKQRTLLYCYEHLYQKVFPIKLQKNETLNA